MKSTSIYSPNPAGLPPQAGGITSRPVAIWVLTGVIMLLIQVILGGITRLTGSGLSITEWNVMTGAVPPLNETQWLETFGKYKQTTQYQILNTGFTLSDFKFIFFWEWFHRLWARMVGVVFIIGFVWFLWKKEMKSWMVRPLIILFLLGALQGAIGWIMVASGLTGDAIYVAPVKLALHFVFALGLISYAFWFALQLFLPFPFRTGAAGAGGPASSAGVGRLPLGGPDSTSCHKIARWTIAILIVLFFQLLYGALMAGHKAATAAPSWPTINGDWLPAAAFSERPLIRDLFGNKITVHFVHRSIAYLLLLMVGVWSAATFRLRGKRGYIYRWRWLPPTLIVLQVLLGITSLLASPGIIPQHWVAFDWLAQFHQITGLLFLMAMIGMLYLVKYDVKSYDANS